MGASFPLSSHAWLRCRDTSQGQRREFENRDQVDRWGWGVFGESGRERRSVVTARPGGAEGAGPSSAEQDAYPASYPLHIVRAPLVGAPARPRASRKNKKSRILSYAAFQDKCRRPLRCAAAAPVGRWAKCSSTTALPPLRPTHGAKTRTATQSLTWLFSINAGDDLLSPLRFTPVVRYAL